MSHDPRTPLLAIRGMAELLEEAVARDDADEAAFLLRRVTRNVDKMGDLLNDLLALSRIGRLAEPSAPVDLAWVLAAVMAELESRRASRPVAVEAPALCPRVLYSPSEAYQLLANLIGNAAKFAGRPGEEPSVVVTCSSEGGLVTLRVSDNGPGLQPQYREKVFGLFQKLDPKAEGTGVGLAIVKRIAERHGGRVWVEDSPLGGATFAVTMPALPGD